MAYTRQMKSYPYNSYLHFSSFQPRLPLSVSSSVLQPYIREEMAAQPPPPPPPPPTPSFSFSAPTIGGENPGPLQKIAALQQQARQEATPYGYYGPMYVSALHAVAPEGPGGKGPPLLGGVCQQLPAGFTSATTAAPAASWSNTGSWRAGLLQSASMG